MPHPFLPNTPGGIESRPKMLLEKPALSAGIGLVISEWAQLEEHLIDLFKFSLFGMNGDRAAGEVVNIAWDSLESTHTRLNILLAVANGRFTVDQHKYFEEVICKEVRARAKERNRIAHGRWGANAKYPDEIILLSHNDEPMRYSIKDFEDIADRMIDTSNKIATFLLGVVGKLSQSSAGI